MELTQQELKSFFEEIMPMIVMKHENLLSLIAISIDVRENEIRVSLLMDLMKTSLANQTIKNSNQLTK